jgi:alkaline phosphatase
VSDRRTAAHTASDVPISAYAADPEVWQLFVGAQRNTDVFFHVARAMLGNAR